VSANADTLRVAAIVLAAGRSSRMGGERTKLVSMLEGMPLVAHAVDAALGSGAMPVVVVTGHDAAAVHDALAGREVVFAHNPDFGQGLASSLQTGLRALRQDVDATLVCLGDMPRVRASHLRRLIETFRAGGPDRICVPTYEGRRGNPVLWPASDFAELMHLSGDVGARELLERHADRVLRVAMDDDAVLLDVDSEDALQKLER